MLARSAQRAAMEAGIARDVAAGETFAAKATRRHDPLADIPSNPLRVLTLDQLLTIKIPEREAILEPWLLTQSISMIHAYRGVGKTHVALGVFYAIGTGGEFLAWRAPQAPPVFYIDGETPAAALRDRLAKLVDPTSATSTQRCCGSRRRTFSPGRCRT